MILVVFTISIPLSAVGTVWTVNPDGSGDFTYIQSALDSPAVLDGDVIELGSGTFNGLFNTELSCTKGVTIRSAAAHADSCIIDVQNIFARFGIQFGTPGRQEATLENITIRNGNEYFGAGIRTWYSSPTIRGCVIEDCRTQSDGHSHGAGIYIKGGAPLVENCIIRNNSAYGSGGGGGIMCWDSSAEIRFCQIQDNFCEERGGGIEIWGALSDVTITDCEITGNESLMYIGGGVYAQALATFRRCFIAENSANNGGGIACVGGDPIVIEHCVIVENEGSGILSYYFAPQIIGNTVAYNDGDGGISFAYDGDYGGVVENNIVAFTINGVGIYHQEGETIPIACCDIYGNDGGDYVGCIAGQNGVDGNISADPLFCGDGYPNAPYGIDSDSPCDDYPGCDLIGAIGVSCGVVGAEETPAAKTLSLAAHPNPFNPKTSIHFELPAAGHVELSIYDVSGRRLAILLAERREAGPQSIEWMAKDDRGQELSSGVYIAQLSFANTLLAEKLILVR